MGTGDFGPVGAEAGTLVRFGDSFTARTLLEAQSEAGGFSVVEHFLGRRELAAPLHLHTREDEFTIVTAGRIGFLLGDDVFHAGPGELVRKPRNQWHTFWNAGDDRAQVLEIISPAGFEQYFQDIAEYFPDDAPPNLDGMAAASAKYGLQMDFGSLPLLLERFDLARPPEMDTRPPTPPAV